MGNEIIHCVECGGIIDEDEFECPHCGELQYIDHEEEQDS